MGNISRFKTGLSRLSGIDNTPTDADIWDAISSNWAYDHAALTTGVHGTEVSIPTRSEMLTPTPASRDWSYLRPATSARVAFLFDDSRLEWYTYRSVFTTRNVPLSMALWIDKVGGTNITWEQIRELVYDYGWEASSHSKTHAGFSGITENQMRDEVVLAHRELLRQGLQPAPYYVYAGGIDGGSIGRAIVSEVYPYAFSVTEKIINGDAAHYLPRPKIENQRPLAEITALIDNAIANNTGVVFYAHSIVDGIITDESEGYVSTGKLGDIMDYCDANGVSVVKASEVLRYSNICTPVDIGDQSFINLLENGNFEVGDPPVGWFVFHGSHERSIEQVKIGTYSMKVQSGTNNYGHIYQSVPNYNHYEGRVLTMGCWVWASTPSNARIQLSDYKDAGWDHRLSAYHPGDSLWHWLTVSKLMRTGITDLRVWAYPNGADAIGYFDGAILVEGGACPAFSPKPDQSLINHHTAAYTISRYETGHILHTNLGAGGAVTITLPQTVSAGFTCRFAVMTAQELRIDPGAAGAIYINGAKQTDDKYITADDEVESIILTADGNGDWIASSVVGTWGVEV